MTQDLKRCRIVARLIALVYNWWNIFARLARPDQHMEAITSRPLLLNAVGRLVKTGRIQNLREERSERIFLAENSIAAVVTFFIFLQKVFGDEPPETFAELFKGLFLHYDPVVGQFLRRGSTFFIQRMDVEFLRKQRCIFHVENLHIHASLSTRKPTFSNVFGGFRRAKAA